MPLLFQWESTQPDRPPAEQVEDALTAALHHFSDPRKICHSIVVAHLQQDKLGRNVEGVGRAQDGTPIVTFRYSLIEPWTFGCDYYDIPLYPQS